MIAIIAILMSFIFPTVNSARKSARQADCRSNLRQFGIALTVYRADHNGKNPDWMSNLYPKYIDSKEVYVCKSDQKRGIGTNLPDKLTLPPRDGGYGLTAYPETIDNDSRNPRPTDQKFGEDGVKANSYFYEFSSAVCSWCDTQAKVVGMFGSHVRIDMVDTDGNNKLSWNEVKEYQLRHGDTYRGLTATRSVPYSASRMPIIRCWHHWSESKIPGYSDQKAVKLSHLPLTLNVAYAGNVLVAPPWWEGSLDPGETSK